MKLKQFYKDKPEPGRQFMAIFNDFSGGSIFYGLENGRYTSKQYGIEELEFEFFEEAGYFAWFYLSDVFGGVGVGSTEINPTN